MNTTKKSTTLPTNGYLNTAQMTNRYLPLGLSLLVSVLAESISSFDGMSAKYCSKLSARSKVSGALTLSFWSAS
jgi:hypothetical protein